MSDPEAKPARSINQHMAAGAVWMIFARFAIRTIGMISTMILARLLMPEDFGIIAIASTIIGLTGVLTEMGVDVVLIRDQDATVAKYNTAWTLQVLRGLVTASVLLTINVQVGEFFGDPRISDVLQWLALSTALSGFANIGIVDFRKDFQFHRDFALLFLNKIVGFVVTITLAVAWHSYWAMVAGMMAASVTHLVSSYAMHPFRPRVSLQEWRGIFGYSQWLMANSILRYINTRSDTFFVGRLVGSHAAGAYTLAYEISNLALTELVSPIQRALLPGYSKLSNNPDKLREAYIDVLGLAMLLAFPIAAGICIDADLIVGVVLGDKWIETVPLIQITSIAGMIRVGSANTGVVYHALGRPHVITLLTAATMLISIPLLYFGTKEMGPVGTAAAVVVSSLVFLIGNIIAVIGLLSIRINVIFLAVWRAVVATGIMLATVSAFRHLWEYVELDSLLPIWELATTALVGAISFLLAVSVLWRMTGRPVSAERILLTEIARRMSWRSE